MLDKPRVLVTGIDSFTGSYLASALKAVGFEVHGTVQKKEALGLYRYEVNLLNASTLNDVIRTVSPKYVIHLAAITFVDHEDVSEIYSSNIVGTRNLLYSLAKWNHSSQYLDNIILASSANIYGNTNALPISEKTYPNPQNDYAISKFAMEQMALLWASELPITIVRPFNYTGIGQSQRFVIPKIINAYRNRDNSIELGNLDVYRNFSDVRDVVDAYVGLLQNSSQKIFNICSDKVYCLRDVIQTISEISGHKLDIKTSTQLIRKNEVKILQGSAARLHQVLPKWSPRPFYETLSWMLDNI